MYTGNLYTSGMIRNLRLIADIENRQLTFELTCAAQKLAQQAVDVLGVK
jgi:hypothetical protein